MVRLQLCEGSFLLLSEGSGLGHRVLGIIAARCVLLQVSFQLGLALRGFLERSTDRFNLRFCVLDALSEVATTGLAIAHELVVQLLLLLALLCHLLLHVLEHCHYLTDGVCSRSGCFTLRREGCS